MTKISAAKNTALMTIASIGQKVISFVYFTLVARSLGVTATGQYFFALSFTTVFVIFVDMGMTNVLIREVAKTKEHAKDYITTVLGAKLIFGFLTFLVALTTIQMGDYSQQIRDLVYVSAVTMLFDSLNLSLYGVLRGYGTLVYEAGGIIASQLITLILGTTFLFLRLPTMYLMLAFLIPSVLNTCFAATILKKKYALSLRPHFDWSRTKIVLRITIPFALAAILARVYSFADSFLLQRMLGDTAVGLYSIPYKITYAFQFVPLALVAALYPKFSEYFVLDKTKLAHTFEQAIKYLLLIVLPISVGIFVLAQDIVSHIYSSQYVLAIPALKIMILGLVFSYLSFPVGAMLNACSKQSTQTAIVAITLIANVLLNVLLIPLYGISGAASAALIGNMILIGIGYFFVARITDISHWFIGKHILQILLSSVLMGLVVYATNYRFHYFIAIILGMVTYPVFLWATRAVTANELRETLQRIKNT